ncbi:MAG: germination protein YpeB [Clostridia bacterium]|nr:germination protein YpeB [Clostridia bacterium]
MKKSIFIRTVTFCIAAAALSFSSAVYSSRKAASLEYAAKTYRDAALYELISATARMKEDISALKYGADGPSFAETTSRILADSISAESSASRLPLSESHLLEYDRLLNRAGDFCLYLLKSSSDGSEIGAGDIETLERIADATGALNRKLLSSKALIDSGELSFEGLGDSLAGVDLSQVSTIVYDGKYTDKTPGGKSEPAESPSVTVKEAQKTLEEYLGEKASYLYSSDGDIPAFGFSLNNGGIAEVSRGGGLIITISRESESKASGSRIDVKYAKTLFLKECEKLSLPDMKCRRVTESENSFTAVLVPFENGIYLYPDAVKMSISASDGKVLFLNAADYFKNHVKRDLTLAKAAPDGAAAALLQTDGKKEILCFETLSDDVLIYSGADNGLCKKTIRLKENETLFDD